MGSGAHYYEVAETFDFLDSGHTKGFVRQRGIIGCDTFGLKVTPLKLQTSICFLTSQLRKTCESERQLTYLLKNEYKKNQFPHHHPPFLHQKNKENLLTPWHQFRSIHYSLILILNHFLKQ